MAISQSELRILLNLQAKGQEVAAQVAQQIDKVAGAIGNVGRSNGFQQAAQQVNLFGKAVADVSKLAPWEKAILQARQAAAAAQQMGQATQAAGQQGAQAGAAMGGAFANIRQQFAAVQQQAAQFATTLTGAFAGVQRAASLLGGGVAGGINGLMNGIRNFAGGVGGITNQLTGLTRSAAGLPAATANVQGFGSALQNAITIGLGVVGVQSAVTMLTQAFSYVKDAAIGFNAQLENARVAFTSLLGSQDKASAFIMQLQDMAQHTAFDFPGLLQMAQGLVGVGMQAENVIPLLKDVAGAMTAAGRTSTDIHGVGIALQQVLTSGHVMAQDMNQLAQRGIPVWKILAEAIQQPNEKIEDAIARVRKLSEQGKISAAEFFAAFQQYAGAHGLRDLAENAVATFTGAVSNLGDAIRNFVSTATEPMFRSLSAGLQSLQAALTTETVAQFGRNFAATITEMMQPLGLLGLALQMTFDPSKVKVTDMIAVFAKIPQVMRDAFQQSTAAGSSPLQALFDAIVAQAQSIGQDMFGAGYTVIGEYASGIVQGASELIQGAVNLVADMIASQLMGNSPPPQGPLSHIDQGGKNVALAWVGGFATGFEGIGAIAIPVVDAFGNVGKALTEVDARAEFTNARGNLTALKKAGDDVEGVLRNLGDDIRVVNDLQNDNRTAIDTIKAGYGDQLDALHETIDGIKEQNTYAEDYAKLIQQQNDAISQQADLRDRIALNELKAAQIAAEGDPTKRAEIVKQQSILKSREDELRLRERGQQLDKQAVDAAQAQDKYQERLANWEKQRHEAMKAGRDFTTARPDAPDPKDQQTARERLDLDRQQLQLEQQLNGLTDKGRLAEIEAQRSVIERNAALRKVEEDRAKAATETIKDAAEIERAQRAILALPLEQQVKELERAQKAELSPLERQQQYLQRQNQELSAVRAHWQGIKQDIDAATSAQKTLETEQKKAEKTGKGGGGLFPGGAPALDRQEIDVAEAAKKVGNSFLDSMKGAIELAAPKIIGGALGAAVGGSLFGPLGFIAGAAFGEQVAAGVEARVPNLTTIIGDIGRTFVQAFSGDWSPDETLAPVINAVGVVGIVVKGVADTIAAAWNALKGPVGAAANFLRQNMGLVAAAATGLLVPAIAAIGGLISLVFSPIVALLAPITPAMLAVAAAAVALKLIWDANLGGIQQLVARAFPFILAAFEQLRGAFALLASGDVMGALTGLLAAVDSVGQGLTVIIQGWAQAFIAWLPTAMGYLQAAGAAILGWIAAQAPSWLAALGAWTQAFIGWISPMIAPALAALGSYVTAIIGWIGQNAEPFLRQLLVWGQAFAAWIGPMIPPALMALASLADSLLVWIGQQIPPITQALAKWSVIFLAWIVTDVLPQIPGLLLLLGEAIISGIMVLVPQLLQFGLDMSAALGAGIMDGIREVAPEFAATLEALIANAISIFNTIVAAVQDIAAQVVAAWNAIPAVMQAIWDAIIGIWNAGVAAVQAAVEALWSTIQAAWQAGGDAINAIGSAIWNSLSTETQNSLTLMVSTAQALWATLQAATTAAWTAISALVASTLETISTVIAGWIAKNEAEWTTFVTVLTALWDGLVAIASTTWQLLVDTITGIVTPWWQTAQTFWNGTITFLTDLWNKAGSVIGPAVKGLLDGITKLFTDWWTGEMAKAQQWGELGLNIATWILDALKTGINNKIKEVAGALTGAMQMLMDIINRTMGGGGKAGQGIDTSGSLQQTSISAARKYNLDPRLFVAQLQQESGFDPGALSKAGARGVAQFMPETAADMARKLGVTMEQFWGDANIQIEAAAMHMRELVDEFGDYDKALAAYNAGAGAVQKYGGVPPYAETRNYVSTIRANAANVTIPMGMGQGMSGTPLSQVANLDMNQFDMGLPTEEAKAACGPYAAWVFARAVGRNPTAQEAADLARKFGWTTAGMKGPGAETNLINSLVSGSGYSARQVEPTAGNIDTALGQGSPVAISTPNHYFVARGGTAAGGLNVGKTGSLYAGGSGTMTLEQIAALGGGLQSIIVLTGQMGDAFTAADSESAQAVQDITVPVEAANVQAASLAATLAQSVAPAGATAGNAIQQMTTQISPLMASVAAGTMTTQEMVTAIAQLAANTRLTDAPLRLLQGGSEDLAGAMGGVLTAAAQADPAFATLQAMLQATGADAQAMAVTFIEGVGNATGNASAALTEMAGHIDPLIASIAAGTTGGTELDATLVQMASSAGLATGPFRDMQNGVMTSNEALGQLIEQTKDVNPGFAALADEVKQAGTVSQAAAIQYAQLIAAYTKVPAATDDIVQGQQEVAASTVDTSQQIVTAGNQASGEYSDVMVVGIGNAISTVNGMQDQAFAAGRNIGAALNAGISKGLEETADSILAQAKQNVENTIAAMRNAADAHSPSRETHTLGRDMNRGLVQAFDSSPAPSAAGHVVDQTMSVMRSGFSEPVEAPVIPGPVFQNEQTAAPLQYISPADTLKSRNAFMPSAQTRAGLSAKQADPSVGAGNQEYIKAYLEAADQYMAKENLVQAATKTTLELNIKIAQETQRILPIKQAIADTEKAVAAAQKGSVEDQLKLVDIQTSRLQLQQQENVLQVGATGAARALRSLQQQQEAAQKVSLATQLEMADAQRQISANALEEARANQQMLPLKNQIRNVQQAIDTMTKGTVASQVAAIQADAQSARQKIELLRIQDQLDSGVGGTTMSQDQINALHEQAGAMKAQQEHANKMTQIADLQRTIDTAGARSSLVGLQDQLQQREQALQPIQDQTAALQAQTAVQKALGDFQAAGFTAAIINAQELVNDYGKQKQSLDDQLEDLGLQEALIKNNHELAAMGFQKQLILQNDMLERESQTLVQEQRRLETIGAQSAVYQAQLQLVQHLHDELERIGLINENPPEPATTTQPVAPGVEEPKSATGSKKKAASSGAAAGSGGGASSASSSMDTLSSSADRATTSLGKTNDALNPGTARAAQQASTALNGASKTTNTFAVDLGNVGTNLEEISGKKTTVVLDGHQVTLTEGQTRILTDTLNTVENSPVTVTVDGQTITLSTDQTNLLRGSLNTLDRMNTQVTVQDQPVQDATDSVDGLGTDLDTMDSATTTINVDSQQADDAIDAVNTAGENLDTVFGQDYIAKIQADQITTADGNVGDLDTSLTDTLKQPTWVAKIQPKAITDATDNVDELDATLTDTIQQPTWAVKVDDKRVDDSTANVDEEKTALVNTFTTPTYRLAINQQSLDTAKTDTGAEVGLLNQIPNQKDINIVKTTLDQAAGQSSFTLNNLTSLSKGQQGDGVWNAIFGMKTTQAFDVGTITAGGSTLNSVQLKDIGDIDASGALKAAGDADVSGDLTAGDLSAGDLTADGDLKTGDAKVDGDFKANDTTLKDVTAKDASFRGSEITKSDVDRMDVDDFNGGPSARARGGPVWRNVMSMVGEHGPELFVPPMDGMILNHAATERALRDIDTMGTRPETTLRHRQAGGMVWGGRPYMGGEAGRELGVYSMPMAPMVERQNIRIVQVSVEYHSYVDNGISGERSLHDVVSDAVGFYESQGPM